MSKKAEAKQIDPKIVEQIAADVEQGISLNARGEPRRAREVLLRAKVAAVAAGIESATLMWACAATADYLQDAAAAMKYSAVAVRLDPLSPAFRRSRAIIIERVRRTLIEADPRAAIIPEFVALLAEAGLEDADVLFALAVHHAVLGDAQAALLVLDRLVVLAPDNMDVWRMKSDLHARRAEHHLADQCRARAAKVPAVNVPGAEA
jgi:tetratricopeptide (TPR) repeat protein